MSSSQFAGKVVLITGASAGIGEGTAISFSKKGASVVLVGRNEKNLEKVSNECRKNGSNVLAVKADIMIESDVERIMQETIKTFSTLDILINNAGICQRGSIETTSLEQYDTIMNTNLRAVYHLTMLATPHLIKSKGCIVNVSSLASSGVIPGIIAYSLSKAALDQFTKTVAVELGPKNVRVNGVCPGMILTDMPQRAGFDEKDLEKLMEASKTDNALGRPGEIDEVVQTIVFLASDEASYITAANIPVDGGRRAMIKL